MDPFKVNLVAEYERELEADLRAVRVDMAGGKSNLWKHESE